MIFKCRKEKNVQKKESDLSSRKYRPIDPRSIANHQLSSNPSLHGNGTQYAQKGNINRHTSSGVVVVGKGKSAHSNAQL